MTPECSSCGAPQRADAIFCRSCGARLDGSLAPSPSVAPGPASVRTDSRLLGLALCSYFALLAVSLVVLASGGIAVEDLRRVELVLLALAVVTILASARPYPTIKQCLTLPRGVSAVVVVRIVLGIIAGLSAAGLLSTVLPMTDVETMREYREQGQTFAHALLDYSVVAPLLEEIVFRGIVLGALIVPLSRTGALWTSSLMFATLHLSPLSFVHHTLIGLVAGYARLETKSLLLPIAIHAIYNAIIVSVAWPGQ